MSESQYIPDPDELEDDAAGEQDELYEHYSICLLYTSDAADE